MATRITSLRMQPQGTSEAQRIARLQAMQLRLLRAAEQLLKAMKQVGDGVYAIDAGDVLALRYQVRESRKVYPVRNEGRS